MIQSYIAKKTFLKWENDSSIKWAKNKKKKKVHVILSGNVLKTQSTKQFENQKNKSEEDVHGIFKATELKTFWKQLL